MGADAPIPPMMIYRRPRRGAPAAASLLKVWSDTKIPFLFQYLIHKKANKINLPAQQRPAEASPRPPKGVGNIPTEMELLETVRNNRDPFISKAPRA